MDHSLTFKIPYPKQHSAPLKTKALKTSDQRPKCLRPIKHLKCFLCFQLIRTYLNSCHKSSHIQLAASAPTGSFPQWHESLSPTEHQLTSPTWISRVLWYEIWCQVWKLKTNMSPCKQSVWVVTHIAHLWDRQWFLDRPEGSYRDHRYSTYSVLRSHISSLHMVTGQCRDPLNTSNNSHN